ncbi:hypothetical protein T484DRAFT_1935533 [Baffinella frigidus]|nr:hypothetical protein T484DRAFT_1935533 [Cryptophyta sp. CCMP2293]
MSWRRVASVVLSAFSLVLLLVATRQAPPSQSAGELAESGAEEARLCFGKDCVLASERFAKALITSERGAFLLGEKMGVKVGAKQAALASMQKRNDVRLYQRTTLQDAIKHRPLEGGAVFRRPAEKAPAWKSEWFNIFHRRA